MFSRRPDKHTTGFINLRNDCFANSSVQAYSALPGLTEYLNQFYRSYQGLVSFVRSRGIDVDALVKIHMAKCRDANDKFKNSHPKLDIPLHVALAKMVDKLQQTQMTTHTISVWPFLHTLEAIFNAKISRSQHDAQELTQLINETLEHENTKLRDFLHNVAENLHTLIKHASVQDYKAVEQIVVPEFPFSGLILTQMKCLQCGGVSKPSLTPFVMLTLHAPQAPQTDLDTLLGENEQEQIEGYQCLRCRINAIKESEKNKGQSDEGTLSSLFSLADSLLINDDLPEPLEAFVKSYNRNGCDISKVTSTVFRKAQILKPPKIFGLHLSRSSFVGGAISRNQCRVKFKDHLSLSIGKEYYEELVRYNQQEHVQATSSSRVLTTDVDDMIDEDVQREDIDEKGEEEDDTETETETETDLETTSDDSESDSDQSLSTYKDSTDQTSVRTQKEDTPTLNNAPITSDQKSDLKQHFRRFKFNQNDVYKYRLKAMIRHAGSHSQGHYECYKHKPLFVKDADGGIFKLAPEILQDMSDGRFASTLVDEVAEKTQALSVEEEPGLRRRLTTIMGRRPSIQQAHPTNISEIVHSGLQTPAEFMVGGLDRQPDYFSAYVEKKEEEEKKVKMKKISSLIKNPFWRISDASVSEVSKDSVLLEQTSVYMLYYERVDRDQIRKK